MPFSKFLRFMVWTMDAIMGMAGGTLWFAHLQWELKAEKFTGIRDQNSVLFAKITDILIH